MGTSAPRAPSPFEDTSFSIIEGFQAASASNCVAPSSVSKKRKAFEHEPKHPNTLSRNGNRKRCCTVSNDSESSDMFLHNEQFMFPTPSTFDQGNTYISSISATPQQGLSDDLLGEFEDTLMLETLEELNMNLDSISETTLGIEGYQDAELETLLEDFYEPADGTISQTPNDLVTNNHEDHSSEFDDNEVLELMETQEISNIAYPPSSVIRENDPEARSDGSFNSNLQYSSPRPSSNVSSNISDQSQLSQDVDWRPIRNQLQDKPQLPSSAQYSKTISNRGASTLPESTQSTSSNAHTQDPEPNRGSDQTFSIGPMILKPHKTFFGLQEMLDANLAMFKNQPYVIFELFARVSYSSRENFINKQHFQFRDLIKECPPFLNGSLSG